MLTPRPLHALIRSGQKVACNGAIINQEAKQNQVYRVDENHSRATDSSPKLADENFFLIRALGVGNFLLTDCPVSQFVGGSTCDPVVKAQLRFAAFSRVTWLMSTHLEMPR